MESNLVIKHLIGNTEHKSEEYFDVKDPGMFRQTVAKVASGNDEIVEKAVYAADEAFDQWRHKDKFERIQMVLDAVQALEMMIPDLTRIFVRENGAVLNEAAGDFPRAIGAVKHTAKLAESFLESKIVEDDISRMTIEKAPQGVVVAIIPWNSPIILTMSKIAPALLTGNTVVVKPSPTCPVSVSLALKTMSEHLPPGVINVVHGGPEVGSSLCKHPLVRKIAFTGGTSTGRAVMADASGTIKTLSLELGGNDPAIILDDVNMDDILEKLVRGAFVRSGQICYAVKRIYVPETIYETFFDKMCQLVDEFVVGYGLDERSTLGPVNNEKQYRYVNGLINRIKKSNAFVRELGKKLNPESWKDGYYIQPAVVKNVDPYDEVVTCEQFGPVIPLVSYKKVDEAIQMANSTEYGLASSVWSSDLDRAMEVAEQIEAGATFINSHDRQSAGPNMPFGGVKQSGIGRGRTEIGLSEYIEYHAIRYLKNV